MRDGWFHTGDMATVDEDGYYFIVDRKKDLIIRGGYNVYPRDVEEVLYEHPAVREAAVIGVPHDALGEEVAAVVALKPSCRGRAWPATSRSRCACATARASGSARSGRTTGPSWATPSRA
jgi:acyl-CoA synthetase (AMP-forming)/AMP-acid ligase II